jgi:hypothetical protein
MNKAKLVCSALVVASGMVLASVGGPASAQAKRVQPERTLLGISLGRPFLEVIRRFGQPSEVQTVALATPAETLPALGGMSPEGASGFGGAPGFGGNGPGAAPFGGGSPFGGGGNSPGGVPTLPPAGGNGPGMGMSPGGNSPFGAPGALTPGQPAMPEYSTAVLWIYKRPGNVRLEFLINEDGRVAQISVAAPAGVSYPGTRTSRGVSLNSTFAQVMEAYGNPERHRMLPGLRFYEAYYSKNYHAAFTFDTQKNMRTVRITIALAD